MGKRIGIMGGTFDPIHIGHLVIAEYAYEQFQLEEVMFMPSANPPHKFSIHTNQEQRKEMIMCGIEDNPHFSLSLIEYERKGIFWTDQNSGQWEKSGIKIYPWRQFALWWFETD